MYDITKLPSLINLGVQGENNATIIEIDISSWAAEYPDAVYQITYRRAGETDVYPAVCEVVDNVLRWSVSSAVTDKAGTGGAVVWAMVDGVRKKSAVLYTSIAPSHVGCDVPPEPVEDWLHDAGLMLGEVAGYAESAGASASEASGYADQAGQVLSSVDTLHDETKIFRDDAEDFAQAAHGSEQTASEKAGQAESAMGAAIAAADEAGRYYASLIGTELEVDVINGTLNLYSAGDYSPIDIELNDRSLEVWGA